MDHLQQFTKARAVGVPVVAIETPDQEATIGAVVKKIKNGGKVVLVAWDVVRGMSALTEFSGQYLASLASNPGELRGRTINLTETLDLAREFPDDAVLFVRNAHRFIEAPDVSQAVANLRDPNKGHGRMLVLLAPMLRLPVELERDVVVLEEPLPGDEQLKEIVKGVIDDAGHDAPTAERMDDLVGATRGLAAFPAEQAAAMALDAKGIDRAELWERKRKMIELSPGMKVLRTGITFDKIGGIANAKTFGTAIFGGQARPTCVVFVDELEKFLGGASGEIGDSSGVAQDALGVLLRAMEENEWTGQICVGPPGTAKSMYAQALGGSHDVPTIALDLGAAKGSLVGQSEARVRGIVKTLKAVAGKGAYWAATCNRLEALPPELRRRFRFGLWYFDLPDADERSVIWNLQLAAYGIREEQKRELPGDDGWTGADIRNCCEIAWRLKSSLVAASQFITPVSKSDPESIEKLRAVAHRRFLSASYSGTYDKERKKETKGRKIDLT